MQLVVVDGGQAVVVVWHFVLLVLQILVVAPVYGPQPHYEVPNVEGEVDDVVPNFRPFFNVPLLKSILVVTNPEKRHEGYELQPEEGKANS